MSNKKSANAVRLGMFNKFMGHGAIRGVRVPDDAYVTDNGDTDTLIVTFEDGTEVAIEAQCQHDGCGDWDYNYLEVT